MITNSLPLCKFDMQTWTILRGIAKSPERTFSIYHAAILNLSSMALSTSRRLSG